MVDQIRISILLPTRKRIASLIRSAESLLHTCASAELEFMVAVDDDDRETLESLQLAPLPNMHLLVGPRLGYIKLHHYVNELAVNASGDWLFLWNDDALLETPDWDQIVADYAGQFVVLNPGTNHANHPRENCIFPIVSKQWVDILGHFSLSNHNDTYVEYIANQLGIRRDVEVFVKHDRADLTGSNDDEVYAEREFTTSSFYGPENLENMNRDIEKLRSAVEAIGT